MSPGELGTEHDPAAIPTLASPRVRRRLPALVGAVMAGTFAALSVLAWSVADQNEQQLLDKQVDQAGAALALSIEQVHAPLDAAARSARATEGDASVFETMVAPLLDDASGIYRGVALFEVGSPGPVAAVGEPLGLLESDATVLQMLQSASVHPFVVVDLLERGRTVGFASADDLAAPRFVVYTERTLSDDPMVRRRFDTPFSSFDYAMYIGVEERPSALLGASVGDLPLDGRRATTTIPYGDREILLVGASVAPLGGALMTNLWWIVALIGAALTAATIVLLRRLDASRREAVALAAQNAQKHDEQRDIAETLQLSLLPRHLASPPGTAVASRYWPAGTAALIGGDFYDMFPIDAHRWGIVIGDVCGKGIEAAALTGLARHTIRSAARSGQSPSEVLRSVHLAMSDHRPATFCTACFVTFVAAEDASDQSPDRSLDGRGRVGQLVVALGGHPAPLLGRGGEVVPVGQQGGILGMVEPTITDVVVDVRADDVLVLYTDGLTDAPRGEAVPVDEIAEVIRRHRSGDVDLLADTIRQLKRSRRPSGSSDDTAVLVIRFGAAPEAPLEIAAAGDATSTPDVVPV